jgi:hypothetical protein
MGRSGAVSGGALEMTGHAGYGEMRVSLIGISAVLL